jgi:hypothetical protein
VKQLDYLEAAEDNLNTNLDNEKILEEFIMRGQSVAENLEKEYKSMWENPLKKQDE